MRSDQECWSFSSRLLGQSVRRHVIICLFLVVHHPNRVGIIPRNGLEQAADLGNWNTPNAIIPIVVGNNVNVTPIATLIARNKARIGMDELIGNVKWLLRLPPLVLKVVKLIYIMSVRSMDMLPP